MAILEKMGIYGWREEKDEETLRTSSLLYGHGRATLEIRDTSSGTTGKQSSSEEAFSKMSRELNG